MIESVSPCQTDIILTRATKQVAEGVTNRSGGNDLSTAMLNALITYLQGLAQ